MIESEKSILIADDSPSKLELVSLVTERFVQGKGFKIIEAEDGASAIDCINSVSSIQAALIDYEMPGADGPEVIRHLRKVEEEQKRARALIALVTSSRGTLFEERRTKAIEAGADAAIALHACNDRYREQLEEFLKPLIETT